MLFAYYGLFLQIGTGCGSLMIHRCVAILSTVLQLLSIKEFYIEEYISQNYPLGSMAF
jgi:hypothetical protein